MRGVAKWPRLSTRIHAKNVDCSFPNPNGQNLARKQQNSDPIRLGIEPDREIREKKQKTAMVIVMVTITLDGYWFYLSIISEMESHCRCDRVLYRTFKNFPQKGNPRQGYHAKKGMQRYSEMHPLSPIACNSISPPLHHAPEWEYTIHLQSQAGTQIHICQLLNIEGCK